MADEKRDWVEEAYHSFLMDESNIEPTNPVLAIEKHFEKNASPEIKERCAAEGKTAESCWEFIEAVARRVSRGQAKGCCHIDPVVIYAIAMHYFEDVPKHWQKSSGNAQPAPKNDTPHPQPAPKKEEKRPKPAPKKEEKRPKPKKQKHGREQGSFLDALESPPEQTAADTEESEVQHADSTADE